MEAWPYKTTKVCIELSFLRTSPHLDLTSLCRFCSPAVDLAQDQRGEPNDTECERSRDNLPSMRRYMPSKMSADSPLNQPCAWNPIFSPRSSPNLFSLSSYFLFPFSDCQIHLPMLPFSDLARPSTPPPGPSTSCETPRHTVTAEKALARAEAQDYEWSLFQETDSQV